MFYACETRLTLGAELVLFHNHTIHGQLTICAFFSIRVDVNNNQVAQMEDLPDDIFRPIDELLVRIQSTSVFTVV